MSVLAPLSRVRQRLAMALSFVDAFSADPSAPPFLRSPLRVRVPSLDWEAVTSRSDGIYRFSYPPTLPLPTVVEVEVVSERGDYVDFEPLQVSLPLAVSSPPRRSDFWFVRKLWPTRSLSAVTSETAVVGRITSPSAQPVAGLRVVMHPSPAPPPGSPYTYTDGNGEFLFRFPQLPGSVPGGPQTVHIQVTDPTNNPVPTLPTSTSILLGRRQFVGLERN